MVGLCALSYVLDQAFFTGPVHKKTRSHPPFFQYSNSWLSGIKMEFKYWTIWSLTSYRPFKLQVLYCLFCPGLIPRTG